MTYADMLINAGLVLLAIAGAGSFVGGFATAMTRLDIGGRVWLPLLICIVGTLIAVFAIVTLSYRSQ